MSDSVRSEALGIATALCVQFEGCRLTPYLDPSGVSTIGVGCTYLADGSRVTMQTPPLPDNEAAYALLDDALSKVADSVDGLIKRVPHAPPLQPYQLGALYSFAFNIGPTAFAGSTVLERVNNDVALSQICQALESWVYAHVNGRLVAVSGLVKRRTAEAACYLRKSVPKPYAVSD